MGKTERTIFPGEREDSHGANQRTELGDFSTTLRVLPISALAVVIGALCAFVALALLRLIGLFTNLFYFGRWGTALVSPPRKSWWNAPSQQVGAFLREHEKLVPR